MHQERVVTASLRVVPMEMRVGVEALFQLFAVFAEDALVPAAAIDCLVPLMQLDSKAAEAQQRRLTRRWLQQLLKANVLLGDRGAFDKQRCDDPPRPHLRQLFANLCQRF